MATPLAFVAVMKVTKSDLEKNQFTLAYSYRETKSMMVRTPPGHGRNRKLADDIFNRKSQTESKPETGRMSNLKAIRKDVLPPATSLLPKVP